MLVFITFHFVNTFGRKLAQEDSIPAILGSTLSSIILTPLAVFLTYKAMRDSALFNIDAYLIPLKNLWNKVVKKREV